MNKLIKLASIAFLSSVSFASAQNFSFGLGVSSGGYYGAASVSAPVYRPVAQTQSYYVQPQAAYVQRHYVQPRAHYVQPQAYYAPSRSYYVKPEISYVAQPVVSYVARPVVTRPAYYVTAQPRVESYTSYRYVRRQVVQSYVEAIPSQHSRVVGYDYSYRAAPQSHGYYNY